MSDSWAAANAAGARLGDQRRNRSLAGILTALLAGRGKSWSAALGPRLRQAGGDLVGLDGLRVDGLLEGHYQSTARRCALAGRVVISQDTTSFNFTGLRQTGGLGSLGDRRGGRGLWAHSALALTTDGRPLGLFQLELWSRPEHRKPQSQRPYRERESYKWEKGLRAIARRLPAGCEAVVVADREADVFEYLSAPRPSNIDLVVRCAQPRRCFGSAADDDFIGHLTAGFEATEEAWDERSCGGREVALKVTWRAVHVASPRAWRVARRQRLKLFVVRVEEVDPPTDTAPLRWLLATTLEVRDAASAQAVVELYRRRWRIETQHEVIKKEGLRAERLQLRSTAALRRALALYYVVGVRAMELCYEAREHPDTAADERFEADELEVLAVVSGERPKTLGKAVAEVAKLGGWEGYPSSQPYGPKTVQRGLESLAVMVRFRRAQRDSGSYDP